MTLSTTKPSLLYRTTETWINGFILSGGQVLQIAQAQKEDAGKYTCQAVNDAGEDHMHFELDIQSKQVHHLDLIKGAICMARILLTESEETIGLMLCQ